MWQHIQHVVRLLLLVILFIIELAIETAANMIFWLACKLMRHPFSWRHIMNFKRLKK